MRSRALAGVVAWMVGLTAMGVAAAHAQQSPNNSEFTYQGRLEQGGVAFSGVATVRATLYDAATAGAPQGGPIDRVVAVEDGLFTAVFDFGLVDTVIGPRWIEIAVRPEGDAEFTTLTPRQALAGAAVAGVADRALNTDGVVLSDAPVYTLVASQTQRDNTISLSNHWQSFVPSQSGQLMMLVLPRGGTAYFSGVRIRIYEGEGNVGTVLHEQRTAIVSTGEAVIILAPSGVPVTAGQIYTWEVDLSAGTIGFGFSANDSLPGLNSSLGGGDYVFRAYVGRGGGSTVIRGARVGVGVSSPNANLHVRGTSDIDTLRVESPNANGTWLNLQNTAPGGNVWSIVSTGPSNGEGAGKLLLRNSTQGAPSLVMTTSGVGIGLSNPTSLLNLADNSDAELSGGGVLQIGAVTAANLVLDSNEIMARASGGPAELSLNAQGGNVGVGPAPFNAALHVARVGDVSLTGPALLQVGPTQSGNLAFDTNEIMARANGVAAELSLNAEGGNVGVGPAPFNAALHVARSGDVSLTGPALLQVGQTQSGNLAFDGNELMARNNGAAADLSLNAEGGNVGIGVGPFGATLHVTRGGNLSQLQNGFARFGTTGSFNLNLDTNEVQVLNNGTPTTLFLNFRGGGVFVGDVDATTSNVVLTLNGNAAKPGGGFWATLSDARAKKDIKPLHGTLDRVLSLHGYTFEYTDDAIAQGGALRGTQVGLLAQEVQKVFPEWVYEDDKGRLNVSERGITALMVESLRDLRAEKDAADAAFRSENALLRRDMDAAMARVREVEAENRELRERLERIERMLATP